jgi:hypothetical protein
MFQNASLKIVFRNFDMSLEVINAISQHVMAGD